jgi:hypothetical protein
MAEVCPMMASQTCFAKKKSNPPRDVLEVKKVLGWVAWAIRACS